VREVGWGAAVRAIVRCKQDQKITYAVVQQYCMGVAYALNSNEVWFLLHPAPGALACPTN